MQGPFELLGIDARASERDIKRAYARLLKTTRPQDNPEGFQHLNEAYQAALRWRRNSDDIAWTDDQGTGRDAKPAGGVVGHTSGYNIRLTEEAEAGELVIPGDASALSEVAPQQACSEATDLNRSEQADDVDHVFEEHGNEETNGKDGQGTQPSAHVLAELCIDAAEGAETPQALEAWLNEQDALWNLSVKSSVAQTLDWRLPQREPTIKPNVFDALLAYFGLDVVADGDNRYEHQDLRQRMRLTAALQAADSMELFWLWRQDTGAHPDSQSDFKEMIALIKKPFSLARSLWFSRGFKRAERMRSLLLWLTTGNNEALPPTYDSRHLDYWLRAGDSSRISLPRLGMHLVNWTTVFAGVVALYTLLRYMAPDATGQLSSIWFGFFGVALLIWTYWVYGQHLFSWQLTPEPKLEHRDLPWHSLVLPSIVGFWLVLYEAGMPLAAKLVYAVACVISIHRIKGAVAYKTQSTVLLEKHRLAHWGLFLVLLNAPRWLGADRNADLTYLGFLLAFLAVDSSLRWPLAVLQRRSSNS